MRENKKKVLLIDGNALFFKAFYGTYKRLLDGYERSGKENLPINAVRTFSYMFLNLAKKFESEYVMVAFDKGSNTFRHKHGFYKGNRKKQPDELFQQLPMVKELLGLLGVQTYEADEIEADDIIGIYSFLASNENMEVDIVTTDKDLLQLVNENVKVHLYKGGKEGLLTHDWDNFVELNGVRPNQVADLKALMGDSSDNIKGVPGIGPKTAIKLIQENDTLEKIIDNLDSLPNSISKKISLEVENIFVYKSLTEIIIDPNFIENHTYVLIDIKKEDIKKELVISFLNGLSIFNVADKIRNEF